MKLSLLARKWHKWLALIVGVQLLFWTFSGLFMSAVPIEIIKSEHLSKKQQLQVLSPEKNYFSMGDLIALFDEDQSVVGVELQTILGNPTYIVRTSDDSKHLVGALSGKALSPLSKQKAIRIATRNFSGSPDNISATLINDPVIEFRGKYPVWQIRFNNIERTVFYVSPETGQLQAKRGILWRIYDFVWMLHIMDYNNRSDFNNWLLILAAILGFVVSVSGLLLIKFSFRKRDFNFLRRKKK